MSNIIQDGNTIQDKYKNKDFQTKLDISQEVPQKIKPTLSANNFRVQLLADSAPFIEPDGKIVRFVDIIAEYIPTKEEIRIEAKDFCQLGKYEATGLPIRYIDKITRPNVILIFRDNEKLIPSRMFFWKCSEEMVLNNLEKQGFCKNNNGLYDFVLYGNRLDILMKPENRELRLEKWLTSHFKNYKGELQNLFKMSAMLPIEKIIQNEINRIKDKQNAK